MREGLYEERLVRGVTQVLRKTWAYLREDYTRGGGGLIGGEIRYQNTIGSLMGTLYADKYKRGSPLAGVVL